MDGWDNGRKKQQVTTNKLSVKQEMKDKKKI